MLNNAPADHQLDGNPAWEDAEFAALEDASGWPLFRIPEALEASGWAEDMSPADAAMATNA